VPRHLFLFYFPQDTPPERGPTRTIPGSHYHDHITEADHPFVYIPKDVKAGTCLLAAIDIEHAGISNITDQTRHMLKFNFLRTCSPKEASRDGGNCEWQPPPNYLGRFTHEETRSYVWNWLRGIGKTGFNPATDIDHHISKLNGANRPERLIHWVVWVNPCSNHCWRA
tara:strand:- start:1256 stop:1759 length:504 start_codon:yes stop_codon:yes gene_type:complete